MNENDYDPIGGHTKEEADVAYAKLFKELHGEESEEGSNCSENISIIGHRKPDTGSICSALAYARLKNMIDPGRKYHPYRAGCINKETAYVLRFFNTPEPPLYEERGDVLPEVSRRNIILVDFNDLSQSPDGIYEGMILEIIDHHRLELCKMHEPITIRIQPYGSTATIIYEIYKEKGIVPDKNTAGLLCASIMSDTLFFRTQATLKQDRLAGAESANIAGLDMEAFWAEMSSVKE